VAGCATALALHAAGVADIALFESRSFPSNDWVGESLPPDVSEPLKTLGVWESFQRDGHEPCLGSCAAWGSPILGFNDFVANLNGPGWHIDRPRFDSLLRRTVAGLGVEIRSGQRLKGAEALVHEDGFRLTLMTENGAHTVVARHVVDATGARGAFARRMGSRSIQHDLLVFISATAALAPGAWPSRLTMTETVSDGWWYAAALPGDRLSLALATDPTIARSKRLRELPEWLKAFAATRHIAPRLLDRPFNLSALAVRAAPVSHSDAPCDFRWTAVGDAAAVFDPLGAEGIYKALEDGIRAAKVIAAALHHGRDESDDFAAVVAARTEAHLALRRSFYAMERQWPESQFWTGRQEGLPQSRTSPRSPASPKRTRKRPRS
jgi:flavin-dependent dehydrogenase